jgi:hypothetical protein
LEIKMCERAINGSTEAAPALIAARPFVPLLLRRSHRLAMPLRASQDRAQATR